MLYAHEETIRRIEDAFPALRAELHHELVDGLLHPQLGAFARLAQTFIDGGDRSGWQRVVDVFTDLRLNEDPALENALNVSFLENLDFKDDKLCRLWAYEAMPERMRSAWNEMDMYNRRLHGDE